MGNTLESPIVDKQTSIGNTDSNDPDQVYFGVSSMQGWRLTMEDAHLLQPYVTVNGTSGASPILRIPNHSLFAVFDGHGGNFAAKYASSNLCRILGDTRKFIEYAERIGVYSHQNTSGKNKTKGKKSFGRSSKPKRSSQSKKENKTELCELLESALQNAFVDLDREILQAMISDGLHVEENSSSKRIDENRSVGSACDWDVSFQEDNDSYSAITKTSNEPVIDSEHEAGTTAIVVLLTPEFVVCANIGDSRAVLCCDTNNGLTRGKESNNNEAVPLSVDHKPDNPEETERITRAGGSVNFSRVDGELAVSRALGDFPFKNARTILDSRLGESKCTKQTEMKIAREQKVSCVPDVIFHHRNRLDDKFLVVACDGIWDVLSNEKCIDIIATALQEGERNPGLICEEILDVCLKKGSRDNLSAIFCRFQGQEIGEGGGVMKRRKNRKS